MPKAWHLRKPEEYARQRDEVRGEYPHLHFFAEEPLSIRGMFPAKAGDRIIERFRLEIRVPDTYPRDYPEVRETGGRIPRDRDRHIDSDGKACLFLPEEASIHFPAGSTLRTFLEGPVNSFLVGQLHFEEFGTWPFGQWDHGTGGILQFYAEKTSIDDPSVLVKFVECVASAEVKGHWDCPCGSGKRLRNCHAAEVAQLRAVVKPQIAARSYESLRKAN